MENEFKFKSIEPFFSKEKSGLKNNTVREIDLQDQRFLDLIAWKQQNIRAKKMKTQWITQQKNKLINCKEIALVLWKPKKGIPSLCTCTFNNGMTKLTILNQIIGKIRYLTKKDKILGMETLSQKEVITSEQS